MTRQDLYSEKSSRSLSEGILQGNFKKGCFQEDLRRKVCMRLYVEQRMKCVNIIMIVKRIHWTFEEEIIVWENIELLGYCGGFFFVVLRFFSCFWLCWILIPWPGIRTCVPCSGSADSKPLSLQGSPRVILLTICEITGRRM